MHEKQHAKPAALILLSEQFVLRLLLLWCLASRA